ncbi:RNA polymerase sigma factor [Azospirillum doebereinerae]|uniref:Sigma-70 family RNA polymerase sigma factor n=1 Tax=Azospirillum doebereinerae TaxID=92933 RepID=A0A433J7E9_9PROT|nr:sigma-70 family RNA polymerase sigma factor [Azospirillum doebereinerae]MCG5241828.1 sigma-70 family RNA polymerase sigma factor [Azospirillum doebereinerae]RUQ69353.1 sigma-70 family RNA polymerase sigma factor [Azospirillum doebereinerae]
MAERDRSSLLRLLIAHYEEMTGHLARRLGSLCLAEDVVQDTYLRLRSLGALPEIDNPRSYLFRMADNIALDRIRAETRMGKRFAPEELGLERPLDEPDAEATLEHKQRLDCLSRALDELPPRCREVFVLHKFDGMSHADIAAHLGISRSMVEKHVMKALAHCRDRLAA